MIRETLLKIRNELPKAITEEFTDHPLADYITNEAKNSIKNSAPPEYQHFTFKGSPGISQWASNRNPWIGIFHPITHPGRKLASQGYYIVYGFPHGVNYVTFGIGQSDDEAVAKFGKKHSKQKLKNFANEMRSLIPGYSDRFQSGRVSLGEDYYREGYVYHKLYDVTDLPDEDELKEDLALMLEAYDELVKKGGRNWIEDENEADEHEYQKPPKKKGRKKCPDSVEVQPQVSGRRPKAKAKTPPPPRNRSYNEEAKENAKFQCEISSSHKTFPRKEDGNYYVEGHHLIPMKQYYKYELRGKNIDHVCNISVLCPNCHMKIHHGNDEVADKIIEKLFRLFGEDLINNYDCDLAILKSYYE